MIELSDEAWKQAKRTAEMRGQTMEEYLTSLMDPPPPKLGYLDAEILRDDRLLSEKLKDRKFPKP